jgi:hypothetical protein
MVFVFLLVLLVWLWFNISSIIDTSKDVILIRKTINGCNNTKKSKWFIFCLLGHSHKFIETKTSQRIDDIYDTYSNFSWLGKYSSAYQLISENTGVDQKYSFECIPTAILVLILQVIMVAILPLMTIYMIAATFHIYSTQNNNNTKTRIENNMNLCDIYH